MLKYIICAIFLYSKTIYGCELIHINTGNNCNTELLTFTPQTHIEDVKKQLAHCSTFNLKDSIITTKPFNNSTLKVFFRNGIVSKVTNVYANLKSSEVEEMFRIINESIQLYHGNAKSTEKNSTTYEDDCYYIKVTTKANTVNEEYICK